MPPTVPRFKSNCATCGKEMWHTAREKAARPAKYCSRSCDMKVRFGSRNPAWKGGKHLSSMGYVYLSICGKKVFEHRVIAEQMLGRKLEDNERVHHKDHDRQNNSPDNLEVMDNGEHSAHHQAMAREVRWAPRSPHTQCIDCGTTKRRHVVSGRCTTCYPRFLRSK